MKRNNLLLAFSFFLLISCKKESKTDDNNQNQNQNPPPATTEFSWKEDGGTTIKADSAYWTTGSWGTGIRAYKGGYSNMFEINWDNQNNISVGTKTLSATNYGFTFIKSSSTYTISSNQSLSISGNSNDKISGSFNVNVTGGTITSISGTFTNLNKK